MTFSETPDFAAARGMMVDSQVRPNKVTNARVIAAMRALPREMFLPPSLQARAYADDNVPLAHGRVLPAPMVIARMVQFTLLEGGTNILVVGAGTGYGAAVLAACGTKVTAVEDDADLLAIARPAWAAYAPGVTLFEGPIAAGAPTGAPYDGLFVEGAVHTLPQTLVDQLAPGGLVVMVRCEAGLRMGQAVIGRKAPGGMSFVPVFDYALPPLPALRPAPEFVF